MHHSRYADFMTDALATVVALYERFAIDLPAEVREAIEPELAVAPPGCAWHAPLRVRRAGAVARRPEDTVRCLLRTHSTSPPKSEPGPPRRSERTNPVRSRHARDAPDASAPARFRAKVRAKARTRRRAASPDMNTRRRLALVTVALAALFAASCSSRPPAELVVFTDDMRLRYELEPEELRQLQFYLSEHVVLERVAEKGAGRVDRGRLIVRSGNDHPSGRRAPQDARRDRERRLHRRTHAAGTALEVSFEKGAPLRFSASRAGRALQPWSTRSNAGCSPTCCGAGGSRAAASSTSRARDGRWWRETARSCSSNGTPRQAESEPRRVLPGVKVDQRR